MLLSESAEPRGSMPALMQSGSKRTSPFSRNFRIHTDGNCRRHCIFKHYRCCYPSFHPMDGSEGDATMQEGNSQLGAGLGPSGETHTFHCCSLDDQRPLASPSMRIHLHQHLVCMIRWLATRKRRNISSSSSVTFLIRLQFE